MNKETIQDNFFTLLALDDTREGDNYRYALFYIIASNQSLYNHVSNIYDFKTHFIKPKVSGPWICGGTNALIKLAFNLYNSNHKVDVNDVFRTLDENNFQVAINAIGIAYCKTSVSDALQIKRN